MRLICLFFLFVMFHSSVTNAAKLDTSFRFSTIETDHFSIHYHQGLDKIARQSATLAEEIHVKLAQEFRWEPREKTQMVLIDDSDFANGMTTVLPYNTMFIQIVPPAINSTIGEYDDWLRTLIIHEYVHVLTMDPTRGYSEITRTIFGKPLPANDLLSLILFVATGPPNVFLPRWWHEGMATWGESEYSTSGRGRSSYYEMILRTAVDENNLPSLDKINGDVPYWPSGHLPYIFGLRLTKYIADQYGSEALGKLNMAHAGRFPYAINTPPEELFNGRDYPELYGEMLSDLKLEQSYRIKTLKKSELTPVNIINKDGENLTAPRFSPDGSLLAFNRHDPHGHTTLVIADKYGKQIQDTRRQYSDDGISWSPDSNTVYFCQAEINRGFNVYQDLYAYDVNKQNIRRLTRGMRLSEPDLAPDGKTFAAIISHRGSQNLVLFDAATVLAGVKTPVLRQATTHSMMRVASPRWSPDSDHIAYTVTDNSGKTEIHLFDVRTNNDRILISGSHVSAYPTWSRDGRYLLYTSDETGVFNLFAYSLDEGKSYQVTHLLGGAFQPDFSPDSKSIVFSSYRSSGFQIAAIIANSDQWNTDRSPAIVPYWQEYDRLSNISEQSTGSNKISANQSQPTPYSPWATLAPHFWLPKVASDDYNKVTVGAFTAGQDVLGYNTYLMELSYGTKSSKIYYNLIYQNDYLYPTFSVQTYAAPMLYSDILRRGDYFEINRGLVVETSVPVNYLESQYRFRLGYHLQDQKALSSLQSGRFNGLEMFEGRRDNIFAGIDFSNSLKYPYSISHEEGRNISLLARYYSRHLGSDLNATEYSASYNEYLPLPKPLLQHHVVYYSLSGAIAAGDRTTQQAFQLGGIPSFLNQFPLRGYPERFETGKYAATGSLEYRAPIWYFLRGFGSKPFFLDRLHGAAFADIGEVWDDEHSFKLNRLKVGAGFEARFDMTVGYWLKITPTLGYAHGFNQGGEDRIYFSINANL